jgi:hypothetical protein
MRYFIWGAIAFVVIVVIGAFFVIGSPAHQRLVRFDERRVGDLAFIQDHIINYWQAKSALPAELADLEDPVRGVSVPVDPKTGLEYEYIANAENTFTLCAVFDLESDKDTEEYGSPYYYGRTPANWQHSAGRACFEREIDPDVYRPLTSEPRLPTQR